MLLRLISIVGGSEGVERDDGLENGAFCREVEEGLDMGATAENNGEVRMVDNVFWKKRGKGQLRIGERLEDGGRPRM